MENLKEAEQENLITMKQKPIENILREELDKELNPTKE